jgi:hypothetical protein
MKNKLMFNVVLSTLLLLPVSVILENSDGVETVNTLQGYLKEWVPSIILSSIVSGIIFGVKKLLKKETSFLNIYYHSSYSIAIFILLSVSLKYF